LDVAFVACLAIVVRILLVSELDLMLKRCPFCHLALGSFARDELLAGKRESWNCAAAFVTPELWRI
jgi:hypothetical protein